MVKIYLVHLRRDRKEVEMYMPHAITLYNAIQYQKQMLNYLVSSHMARQMFSRFIISSAVTTLWLSIRNHYFKYLPPEKPWHKPFFHRRLVLTKTFHPARRLAQWGNNLVIHFHIKINLCANLWGVDIAFWIIDQGEKCNGYMLKSLKKRSLQIKSEWLIPSQLSDVSV